MLLKWATFPFINARLIVIIKLKLCQKGVVMEIGKKIQYFRKQNNFSQEELAEKMDVARQTISKWELGETSPDLLQAKKLSQIFTISLDELTDNDIKDILINKVSNTERLAGIIIKILKWTGFLMIVSILIILFIFSSKKYFEAKPNNMVSDSYGVYCYVNNEKKYYQATTTKENPNVIELNEDAEEVVNKMKIDITKYKSKEKIIKDIKKYIVSNDGKCN